MVNECSDSSRRLHGFGEDMPGVAPRADRVHVLREDREMNFLCEGGEVCALGGNGYADARFVTDLFSYLGELEGRFTRSLLVGFEVDDDNRQVDTRYSTSPQTYHNALEVHYKGFNTQPPG